MHCFTAGWQVFWVFFQPWLTAYLAVRFYMWYHKRRFLAELMAEYEQWVGKPRAQSLASHATNKK